MYDLSFVKKHARYFLKDWQTQSLCVAIDGTDFRSYAYMSKYHDVQFWFHHFNYSKQDEEDISYMKALHIISQICGYKKWEALKSASPEEIDLAGRVLKKVQIKQ
ncbi:MAG: hypothetical protein IJP61_09440 [Treponema sp.]|nr:hypothetical protein [Treponema sp.]